MEWRWLAVLGISALLTGCTDIFSPCAHPGARSVPPASWDKTQSLGGIPGTNCLYGLDIQSIDSGSGEVKATVAEAVIDRNRNRINDYFSRQLFSTSWFTDFRKEDYAFHVHAFTVQDKNDLSQLKEGDKDIAFEGVSGTHLLKLCDGAYMKDRQKRIDEFYKGKDK